MSDSICPPCQSPEVNLERKAELPKSLCPCVSVTPVIKTYNTTVIVEVEQPIIKRCYRDYLQKKVFQKQCTFIDRGCKN